MFSCKKHVYFPILLGLLCGTIIYIWKFRLLGLFDKEIQIFKIEDASMDLCDYSLYIIRQRVISFIMIIIFTFLFSYKLSIILVEFLFGIYYAIVSSALFCQFGLMSYKLIISFFIPHFIIYVICLYYGGKYIINNNCYQNKINNLNFFVKILLIIFLMSIGVFCEVFLKKFL